MAHTFERAFPRIVGANGITVAGEPAPPAGNRFPHGEYFLDAAWPIFAGKAGVLRLGFSENHYRRQVGELWLEISFFTLAILLIAWVGSLFFVRRITRPLAALVKATQEIDRGETNVQVDVQGRMKSHLAVSFNHMVGRQQEDYTRRFEEQARNWSAPTPRPDCLQNRPGDQRPATLEEMRALSV